MSSSCSSASSNGARATGRARRRTRASTSRATGSTATNVLGREVARWAAGITAAGRGEVAAAREHAEAGLLAAEAAGRQAWVLRNVALLGFIELSLGDHAAAHERLGGLPKRLESMGVADPSVHPVLHDVIEALVGVGDLERAEIETRALEKRGRALDRPWALSVAARCRGLLLGARGDLDGAVASLERALVEHERLPMPFERGRTLLALGQVQRRVKQRGAARATLEEALATFDALGAALWAEKARDELARIGGRTSTAGELTPTERRVAEQVAEGRTNKEAAAALFVTVKTVEANLSRVYAKLGIRSRSELASQPRLAGDPAQTVGIPLFRPAWPCRSFDAVASYFPETRRAAAVSRARASRRASHFLVVVLAGILASAFLPASVRAGSVGIAGAKLVWTAAAGENNNILFRVMTSGTFTVWDTGAPLTVGSGCVLVAANTANCPTAGITSLEATAGNGNDSVDAFTITVPATIHGGYGNDQIQGGEANDLLTDGPSECVIREAGNPCQMSGSDTFYGNGGDDNLQGFAFDDYLSGGAGNDSLHGGSDECQFVHWTGTYICNLGGIETLDGGTGNDTIVGGPDADTLIGGDGVDNLNGGERNDILHGGGGNDTLDGGDRYCFLGGIGYCSAGGDDTLNGDDGNDVLNGNVDNDTLNGAGGDDLLDGGYGTDVSNGGSGVDTARYVNRPESLSVNLDDLSNDGAAGEADNVRTDVENVSGGGGADVLVGSSEVTNVLSGGDGDDTLDGGAFTCRSGCQFFHAEADTLDGGAGSNTASYSGHGVPVTVSLLNPSADGSANENDVLISIQKVIGGAAGDFLTGDANANVLTGGPGSDALDGGAGVDRLLENGDVNFTLTDSALTGLGTDSLAGLEEATLTGGAGDNSIDAAGFSGPVTLDGVGGDDELTGGAGGDTLTGGLGSDELVGNGGADGLGGGDGDDQLTGGAGTDSLNGAAGADQLVESGNVNFTLTTTTLTGLGTDTLTSIESASVTGGAGTNALDASAATISVTLDGGAGDDALQGGSGADVLTGGTGNDSLTGALGTDTVLEAGDVNFTLANATLAGLGTDTLATIERAALTGGPSANTLNGFAFAGAVYFDGGAGDDALTGASGDDYLLGGVGLDRVSGSGDVDFTLTDVTLSGAGTDALDSIELATLTGGPASNSLSAAGFSGAATLSGEAGDDTLTGGSGADLLVGGAGVDSFSAGAGNDALQSRDGVLETQVVCGVGADSVSADAADVTAGDCEQALVPHTLTVGRAGPGTGSINSSPAGIACGVDCTETYDSGTSVTLTTAAASGSSFTGWSGACTGSASCVVTMDAAKSVTATFALVMRSLSVAKTGSGTGTVSGTGIDCGADCAESYVDGTSVALSATPATGSTFAGWSGACTGTGTCSVTMNAAATVTALFNAVLPPPPPPVLDTVSPNTSIKSGPPPTTRARTAKLVFSSTEPGSRFQCKLDKGAWSSCATPKTYKRLKKGLRTFQVRAIDAAGNVDRTPAKRTWRVR